MSCGTSSSGIAADFARKRRRQKRYNWVLAFFIPPLAVMVPLAIDFTRYGSYQALWWLLPFLLPAVIVVSLATWNWRCPGCRALLGISLKQKTCHACGMNFCEPEG